MEAKKKGRPKKNKEQTLKATASAQQPQEFSMDISRPSNHDPMEPPVGSSRPVTIIERASGLPLNNSLNSFSIPLDSIVVPDFHGDACEIAIENWLDRFEELAKIRNLDDNRKILAIGNFLKAEALDWYMTTRKHHNDLSYEKLKSLFIGRFGLRLLNPVIEFARLRYDSSKGILDYYKNKRRLGTLAGLSESHIISFMIEGLPNYLSASFVSIQPLTMDHFYEIASKAEANSKLRETCRGDTLIAKKNSSKPQFHSLPQKRKFKPPSLCRICENLGFKNRYHWSQDCFNRNSFKKPRIETMTSNQTSKML